MEATDLSHVLNITLSIFLVILIVTIVFSSLFRGVRNLYSYFVKFRKQNKYKINTSGLLLKKELQEFQELTYDEQVGEVHRIVQGWTSNTVKNDLPIDFNQMKYSVVYNKNNRVFTLTFTDPDRENLIGDSGNIEYIFKNR